MAPPSPAVARYEHVELPSSPKLCFENLPAGKLNCLVSSRGLPCPSQLDHIPSCQTHPGSSLRPLVFGFNNPFL